ncbi:MAG: TetR/AcrR family transcriptional regulator [Polyangiales bacterium]
MNAKTERKERSHEGILDSAARLLREKGIAGAKVAEVMKGAGLTVGGFYAHFPSKEALVDEVFRRTSDRLRRELFDNLDDKAPADRAEIILKRYISARHRDNVERGCPLPATSGEVATTAPSHRDALEHQVSRLADEIARQVGPVGGVEARHVALGMVALMVGALSLSRAVSSREVSDDILRAGRALGRLAFAALRGRDEALVK